LRHPQHHQRAHLQFPATPDKPIPALEALYD
jgi:hypothetical protein